MSDVLNPPKQGVMECGVDENPRGNLLFVCDVLEALDHILDNDDLVESRIQELIVNLEANHTSNRQ